ncbi:MAG: TonB family protein [Sphingomonas bacterium]|nr:TonB family protein [Sphingomonas bacterium]
MHGARIQTDRADRAKAAGAAVLIHLLLGAAFLAGLALQPRLRSDDSLKTFDVREPLPPPPPIAEASSKQAKNKPAPAGRKAQPSPIVAPPSRLPVPQPIAAAPTAGTGSSSNTRAAASGTGTGAGGAGVGSGGGSNRAGRTGARLMSGALGRSDYQEIAAMGSPRGDAELLLLVNPAGSVERCRALRSSGNPAVDHALCQTLIARARFAPAREADGTPLYQDVRYFPNWRR